MYRTRWRLLLDGNVSKGGHADVLHEVKTAFGPIRQKSTQERFSWAGWRLFSEKYDTSCEVMTAPNLKDNNRIADVSTQVQNADACGSFLKGPHAGNKYSSERRVNARNLVIWRCGMKDLRWSHDPLIKMRNRSWLPYQQRGQEVQIWFFNDANLTKRRRSKEELRHARFHKTIEPHETSTSWWRMNNKY